MLCSNCGKNVRDDAAFCPHCGALNSSASTGRSAPKPDASYSYSYSEPAPPSSGRKKRRGVGLIIGGVVAVVAVVVLIAALMVGASALFSSPKGRVEKAIAKTVAAYDDVNDKLGLPDMEKLSASRSVSQRFSLELNSINEQLTGGYDLSALKGLGLRMNTDLDCKGRKMDADLSAYWGSDEIVGAQMLVDDSIMYLGSPQFLGDSFFGMNTETLGADLAEMTGEDEVKTVSFNIFELIDIVAPEGQDKEIEKAMKEANKALMDAVEVKKTGAETIDVNGKSTKTTAYHVVIPQDALEDYVDALEDMMKSMDYIGMYKELLKAMGIPKYVIDQIMYEMEDVDVYGEFAELCKEALDEIGDVELDVYLSGGYVSAVTYEGKISGVKIKAGLYLGGGDQYVDNLSLTIEGDGDEIVMESSGNHSGKGGSFTDKTMFRVKDDGKTLGRVTSEMSYNTSSSDFQWEITVDSGSTAMGSLEMEGQLTASKDSIELVLDDISVRAMGIKLVSLSGEYYVGPCEGMTVKAGSSKMLADLDESGLMEIGYDIQENAEEWAEDMQSLLSDKLPQELLWYLMYYIF